MNIHSKTGSLKQQWYQSHCFSLVSSGNLMFRMDKSAGLWQPLFSWKWSIIRWTHWHLVTVILNFWLLFLHIFYLFFYSSTAASSFPLTTVDEILNSLSFRAQAASKARIAISRGSEGEKRRNRDRHTHKERTVSVGKKWSKYTLSEISRERGKKKKWQRTSARGSRPFVSTLLD